MKVTTKGDQLVQDGCCLGTCGHRVSSRLRLHARHGWLEGTITLHDALGGDLDLQETGIDPMTGRCGAAWKVESEFPDADEDALSDYVLHIATLAAQPPK